MEMPAYNNLRLETRVPIVSLLSPAPDTKARDTWNKHEIFPQRPVIDDDKRNSCICSLLELDLSFCNEPRTPGIPCGVRIRVKQLFICGLNAFF